MITKLYESLICSCHTHQFVLLQNTLITMKKYTFIHIFESSSTHHFFKLVFTILWRYNQETTIKVLQVTELCDRVLYICRMFNLKETIWHLAFVKPYNIYSSCSIRQPIIRKVWNINCRTYLFQRLFQELAILVLCRNISLKILHISNLNNKTLIKPMIENFYTLSFFWMNIKFTHHFIATLFI